MRVDRTAERERFAMAWERVKRQNHHMGDDVPYWVEDAIEAGVSMLRSAWGGLWRSAGICLIASCLYEMYALLNGHPLITRSSIGEVLGVCVMYCLFGSGIAILFFGSVKPSK